VTDADPDPPAPWSLVERYGPQDLDVFTPLERHRFLRAFEPDPAAAWPTVGPVIAWELLYRMEPELYARLVEGERIHPAVLDAMPAGAARAVEMAAGSGRLTFDLAPRCEQLVVVEPARAMRELLRRRLDERGFGHVEVRDGFFDAIPSPDAWADLVISCSALTPDPMHGGEAGLAELERVAAPGGLVMLVWPHGVDWLRDRGFEYQRFDGEMAVEFASLDEAIELAAIFYPWAVDAIRERGERRVPYELLGFDAPRDIAWKRMP
jgi:SAM-dependent methyltransferase